jgi:predicted DNA-binding antitoxin AbrB/MazE fold protein
MITVKAVYENGAIKLLEDAPLHEHQQLLVTLMEETKTENESRNFSLQQPESFKEYLSDEREDLYQDYLKTGK